MTVVVHRLIISPERGEIAQKVVMINFYRPPTNFAISLRHLKFVIASLKQQHSSNCIMVCGDFNMSLDQMEELITQTPLKLIEPVEGW